MTIQKPNSRSSNRHELRVDDQHSSEKKRSEISDEIVETAEVESAYLWRERGTVIDSVSPEETD